VIVRVKNRLSVQDCFGYFANDPSREIFLLFNCFSGVTDPAFIPIHPRYLSVDAMKGKVDASVADRVFSSHLQFFNGKIWDISILRCMLTRCTNIRSIQLNLSSNVADVSSYMNGLRSLESVEITFNNAKLQFLSDLALPHLKMLELDAWLPSSIFSKNTLPITLEELVLSSSRFCRVSDAQVRILCIAIASHVTFFACNRVDFTANQVEMLRTASRKRIAGRALEINISWSRGDSPSDEVRRKMQAWKSEESNLVDVRIFC